eukprot:COSAG06_NODE_14041_length_1195_cov_1.026460_1_plen_369_part_10
MSVSCTKTTVDISAADDNISPLPHGLAGATSPPVSPSTSDDDRQTLPLPTFGSSSACSRSSGPGADEAVAASMLAACLTQDAGEAEQQQILGEVWKELDRLETDDAGDAKRRQPSAAPNPPPILSRDAPSGTALRHVLGRVRTVSATVSADREAERAEFAASLRAEQQQKAALKDAVVGLRHAQSVDSATAALTGWSPTDASPPAASAQGGGSADTRLSAPSPPSARRTTEVYDSFRIPSTVKAEPGLIAPEARRHPATKGPALNIADVEGLARINEPLANAALDNRSSTGKRGRTGGTHRRWTAAEDEKLREFVSNHMDESVRNGDGEARGWSVIAAALDRSNKQCRERWINQVDPSINKGKWTPEED